MGRDRRKHYEYRCFRVESTKADKGIRTLDIQLGKLTLYQLSYARITVDSLSIQPDASLHNPGPSRQVRARPRDTRPDPM